jgi:hypothetical protein
MKKITLYTIITLIFTTGCTQMVTAPIAITGAVVSSSIEIAGATAGAIAGYYDD